MRGGCDIPWGSGEVALDRDVGALQLEQQPGFQLAPQLVIGLLVPGPREPEKVEVLPDRGERPRVLGMARHEMPVEVGHAVPEHVVVQLDGRERPEDCVGHLGHLVEEQGSLLSGEEVQLADAAPSGEERVPAVVLDSVQLDVSGLQSSHRPWVLAELRAGLDLAHLTPVHAAKPVA